MFLSRPFCACACACLSDCLPLCVFMLTHVCLLLCSCLRDSALPFGWEEAYTASGVKYYIECVPLFCFSPHPCTPASRHTFAQPHALAHTPSPSLLLLLCSAATQHRPPSGRIQCPRSTTTLTSSSASHQQMHRHVVHLRVLRLLSITQRVNQNIRFEGWQSACVARAIKRGRSAQ